MNDPIRLIKPEDAARMVEGGARLVDIRGADEHARERIAAAQCRPLELLGDMAGEGPVIFHCRSGKRTAMNSARLAAACPDGAYVLEGGIDAWKAAGLPVLGAAGTSLDIMRQVQIAGGAVILLSVLLALSVAPAWSLLAGSVGIGMLHAGLTGSCAMTRLLEPMPWNRPRSA